MAELFLERVTAQDSENMIAWTLYAMLYEQKGQELNAEITFKKAHKMNQALNTHHDDLNNIEAELQASDKLKADEGKKCSLLAGDQKLLVNFLVCKIQMKHR